jgi:hypothetical protein
MNNPLVYTDPDGEIIIPFLIGAGIGVITNGINNSIHGYDFFMGAGRASLIGGIGGAFSFGIGQAVLGMSGFGQVAMQTLSHGHLGGIMSGMSGGTYGQGFLSGAAGSLIAGGTSSLLKNAGSGFRALGTVAGGGIAGGIGAEISGGEFWDGFRNGAISAGLNHAAHFGVMKLSGVDQIANNAEEVLDNLTAYEEGSKITGETIADLNPEKLSLADNAIKYLTRTETGFNLKMTWLGRQAISLSGLTINDNSHFTVNSLTINQDNIYHINSPGNKIYFNKNLVDFNIYLNNNRWSIYQSINPYHNVWK